MLSMHIVGDGWGYVMGQMLRVQELVLLVPENNVCNKSSKRPKANVVFSVSSLWKIIYRKQFSSFTKDPKNVKPVNGPLFKPQHFQVTLYPFQSIILNHRNYENYFLNFAALLKGYTTTYLLTKCVHVTNFFRNS